ncbi:hypothetical protein L6452_13301 [Arctium lappa]|uniref:Uncharacterized protein n=1 Tax=Arctium lappa TaxID=4217 RepID=A0ACB9CHR8_ARCLA|nr:hypothetical protein L6452_13301 [Arctium lappa]
MHIGFPEFNLKCSRVEFSLREIRMFMLGNESFLFSRLCSGLLEENNFSVMEASNMEEASNMNEISVEINLSRRINTSENEEPIDSHVFDQMDVRNENNTLIDDILIDESVFDHVHEDTSEHIVESSDGTKYFIPNVPDEIKPRLKQQHALKQPTVVITDQCSAMKQAVPFVLTESRHRLCMWHIMKKVPSKVSVNYKVMHSYLMYDGQ